MDSNIKTIPVITDVERNIDGVKMMRCSYYSIQSDTPLPNWNINVSGSESSMFILNLEAILVAPPTAENEFDTVEAIDAMYDFVEQHEGLFVDINDIWIPTTWFGIHIVEQGLVYRISQENFTLCWQLRNDTISMDEFLSKTQNNTDCFVGFSENETEAFKAWTQQQIEQSRVIYQENRDNYLEKIEP